MLLSGVEPDDLPITSSDALQLNYRRLVGANAIKLGSWDKQRTSFHAKSFALSLAFIMRFIITRKWPIIVDLADF